jgi:hypothetical protein
MKGKSNCVVCGRRTSDGIVVCSLCASQLGTPRERSEESISSFKIERRRRS